MSKAGKYLLNILLCRTIARELMLFVAFYATLNNAWVLQWNIFTVRSGDVLLLWVVCVVYVMCLSCLRVCSLLPCGRLLWGGGRGGLTSWLLFVMSNCNFITFPCSILGQACFLIVLIPDLSYFLYHYLYVLITRVWGPQMNRFMYAVLLSN